MKEKIAIIGAGNMGQAFAQGLLRKKVVKESQLLLTNSKTMNNKEVVKQSDIVILAIKPQVMQEVLEEIKDHISGKLVVSIAAGISIESIQKIVGLQTSVVRVMPNLAAKVGKSMSVWVKSEGVTNTQQSSVKTILEAIGLQLQLHDEEKIDKATAISGSGPAYFFYLAELIEQSASELGFSKSEAQKLAKQTLLGSAALLGSTTQSAKTLRKAVTSKGGTTEAALNVFQKNNVDKIMFDGIFAAFKRAKELGL